MRIHLVSYRDQFSCHDYLSKKLVHLVNIFAVLFLLIVITWLYFKVLYKCNEPYLHSYFMLMRKSISCIYDFELTMNIKL